MHTCARVCATILATATSAALVPSARGADYDFRSSAAYAALSPSNRQKLDQADRDVTLIYGALDRYCDEHENDPPDSLDRLVPIYMKYLPQDPFVTGTGSHNYEYTQGARGNHGWIISSKGLPSFPYLADRGNIGLYCAKGWWTPAEIVDLRGMPVEPWQAAVSKNRNYDFRNSAAHAALPIPTRAKLDQVDNDLTLLWGALDRYADRHGDDPPSKLADLVPLYLKELPKDPFASDRAQHDYIYQPGGHRKHAWRIASAGLPDFPLNASDGEGGLFRVKGNWNPRDAGIKK